MSPPASAAVPAVRARVALETLLLSRDLVDHVQRLTWMLTGGDFEALVLWCELACRCGAGAGGGRARTTASAAPSPTLLRDLAQATGVPRETARRKLEKLSTQGHVRRLGAGWVVCVEHLDDSGRDAAHTTARRIRAAIEEARAALSQT
jgi:hypothetical protein